MKINEDTDDVLLRWYNMSSESASLQLRSNVALHDFYKSSIAESYVSQIATEVAGQMEVPVGSCEIITIGIKQ
ncbi:hypothetical protein D3C85_1293980 [compost metagenome]